MIYSYVYARIALLQRKKKLCTKVLPICLNTKRLVRKKITKRALIFHYKLISYNSFFIFQN